MSSAPENDYMRYGRIEEFPEDDNKIPLKRFYEFSGEIPSTIALPSTAELDAKADDVERKAQAFLDMFMVSPELAQVYGPLTFEEANTNVGPRSEVEEAALRELINLPGIREGVRRARMLGKLKGV